MKTRNLKRLISLLLCACMAVGLLPLTAAAVEADGTVSAAIYTGQGSYGEFTGETDSFPVDKTGLILHLSDFSAPLESGYEVESIAFYPEPADPGSTGCSYIWATVRTARHIASCTTCPPRSLR